MPISPSSTAAAPRVSVIMPVYNGETYLAEAIDSVLSQTFPDFELLIHDDGSTDGTAAILRDFASRDGRIRVSSGENLGVGGAPNRMIRDARGDYIARLDADDICLPDRLARQVAILDARPDLDVLGMTAIIIDAAGRRIVENRMAPTHEEIDARHLRGLCSLTHSSVMMRAETLRRAGGYDPEYRSAEDIDLWLRLAEVGRLANAPEPGVKYRIHENSISDTKRDEQMAFCRRAVEAAKARRGVDAPFEYEHWRVEDTTEAKRAHYQRYAWQAWAAGYREGWQHYAWEGVKLAPFSPEAWRTLVFGALRRPQSQG